MEEEQEWKKARGRKAEGRRSEQKERRRTIREKKEENGKETRREEGGVQKSDGQTNKKQIPHFFASPPTDNVRAPPKWAGS